MSSGIEKRGAIELLSTSAGRGARDFLWMGRSPTPGQARTSVAKALPTHYSILAHGRVGFIGEAYAASVISF